MKGNLTIDIGNTTVKAAFFIDDRLVATNRFGRSDLRLLERFISSYKPASAIVCSTASEGDTMPVVRLLDQRCRTVMRLSHDTPLPIGLDYRTPQSLGRDRIATAVGAWGFARDRGLEADVLVIDAGTAITYDLVTAGGIFAGGNIAPGLRLRFKSLHDHTGRLPLVDEEGDLPAMGYDTATAIRSGVVRGLLSEVNACIDDMRLSHPGLTVLVTGGDGEFLCSRLNRDDVNYCEHLADEGLNRIYLYNETNETC